jgi:aspartyl aminopeptidase
LIGCGTQSPFRSILAESIETAGGARESEILSFDLMAYDASPPALVGADGEFLSAGRIDNLVSCHAAVTALLETRSVASDQTRLIVLYDHEEVGSRSASGAAGPFLNSVIDRIAETAGLETDQKAAALARSSLLSVDMAHAVHPNWPERHDRLHRPVLGAGPILKVNANQSYATDAVTAGAFAALCRECGVGLQHFVSRSDYVCGSTIGPITSALTGIRTADVGSPMLAMHSCRELAASADVEPMIRVLAKFLLA